jgi:hypothetical protein
MTIIQITTLGTTIIGLGDDGKPYKWANEQGWVAM